MANTAGLDTTGSAHDGCECGHERYAHCDACMGKLDNGAWCPCMEFIKEAEPDPSDCEGKGYDEWALETTG